MVTQSMVCKKPCEASIYLDVKKALQDELKLYVYLNGVILIEGFDGVVPPKYFTKIETINQLSMNGNNFLTFEDQLYLEEEGYQ